jgi:hypothetical protein
VVFIHNGILLSHKEELSFARRWMELENFILNEVSQAQKAKNHMFSLICDYRSKRNAVISLDMSHTLRGECNAYRRNREREGNLKLKSV